jgi:hypothetical protein
MRNIFLRRSASILRLILSAIILISLSISYAQAEETDNKSIKENDFGQAELLLFLADNSAYEARIQSLLRNNLLTISYECRDIESATRLDPYIYEPITFEEPKSQQTSSKPIIKKPIYGMWRDSFELKGCGKSYLFNFIGIASATALPTVYPLTNGKTKLDPIYQRQAEERAIEKLDEFEGRLCTRGGRKFVSNTKFINYIQEGRGLGPENRGKGWFEEWTMWYCRDIRKVVIAVIEQENTSFNIMARYDPNQ